MSQLQKSVNFDAVVNGLHHNNASTDTALVIYNNRAEHDMAVHL